MPTTATYDLFGEPANPATLTVDSAGYTMGVQFSVTLTAGQTAVLSKIKFFSAAGAASVPSAIGLFAVSGQSLLASQGSAGSPTTWDGIAGSGWIRCTWTSPPALSSGVSYKAAILDTAGNSFYSTTGAYWSTGAGGAGITNGPLSAPANAGGDGGQDTFTTPAGSLLYPATSFNASNYWIDVQVSVTTPDAPAASSSADQMTNSGGDVYDWVWRQGWIRRAE